VFLIFALSQRVIIASSSSGLKQELAMNIATATDDRDQRLIGEKLAGTGRARWVARIRRTSAANCCRTFITEGLLSAEQ
jgi:hypothetical protein